MPDGRPSRAADPAREVQAWLRAQCGNAVRPLGKGECARFSAHSIERGWEISVDLAGATRTLLVLLPAGFPYARPRVALASEETLLRWPHFEELGLACLPVRPINAAEPVETVRAALEDACELVRQCAEGDNATEFRREFISYWGRGLRGDKRPIRSLVTPGGPTRCVAVWRGASWHLVGEDRNAVTTWLAHAGVDRPPAGYTIQDGLLISLPQPPVPADYPNTIPALRAWLERDAPASLPLLNELTDAQTHIVAVIEAPTESGPGLIAISLGGSAEPKVNGFRPGRAPARLRRDTWLAKAALSRQKVERVDAAWIHGRGHDPAQPNLYGKTVVVLGCGAVGSLSAIRLAQSGVGGLILVDPQSLEGPNAGRHALGVRSVGFGKATSLAQEIGRRFPHMRTIDALPRSWAALSDPEREKIAQCDLIVCAIGDWAAEGPINEWHQTRGAVPPIVYGWMEERGAAGHALALLRPGGCIACLLNTDGSMRDPETRWQEGNMLKAEPACGVLYQPFGPVELGYVEMLVADLALDVLLGTVADNAHRICATSTARLAQLGGSWTASHISLRPPGMDGHCAIDRPFSARASCPVCSEE